MSHLDFHQFLNNYDQVSISNPSCESDLLSRIGHRTGEVIHDFANLIYYTKDILKSIKEEESYVASFRKRISFLIQLADQQMKMINDLNDFILNQLDKQDFFDLNLLTKQFYESFLKNLKRIACTLIFESENCILHVHKNAINQILFRILKYASGSMPHGGEVKIQTKIVNANLLQPFQVDNIFKHYIEWKFVFTCYQKEQDSENHESQSHLRERENFIKFEVSFLTRIMKEYEGFIDYINTSTMPFSISLYFPIF
jgi:hypothetical protein